MSQHWRDPPYASPRGYVDPDRPKTAWLRLVCEPELRIKVVAEARREKVTMSEMIRRILREHYDRA